VQSVHAVPPAHTQTMHVPPVHTMPPVSNHQG